MAGKILGTPAERCEWIFGQQMNACPKCGGYNLIYQTPIIMEDVPENFTPKQLLGAWARARKGGNTPLEGVMFLMCRGCGHKGP